MTATTVDIGTALTITPHHVHWLPAATVILMVFVFALIVAVTLGRLLAKPKPVVDCTRCRHERLTGIAEGGVHCLGCHTDFALTTDYLHHPCTKTKVAV